MRSLVFVFASFLFLSYIFGEIREVQTREITTGSANLILEDALEEFTPSAPVSETGGTIAFRECDLDESCEDINASLLQSVRLGDNALFKEAVSKGANLNSSDSHGNTCLHIAAQNGFLNIAKKLLSRGAEIEARNALGLTPLMKASMNNETEIIKLLLAFGASKEALGGLYEQSPISLAASHGAQGSLLFLLTKGANVDAEDIDGWTPLLYAARYGHSDMIIPLLDSGARIDKTDNIHSQTPLMWAAEYGCLECVKILVERDTLVLVWTFTLWISSASLTARSMNEMTAYGWAANGLHSDIVAYLRSKGSTA